MLNIEGGGKKGAVYRILIALGGSLLLHFFVLFRFGEFSSKEWNTQKGAMEVVLAAPLGKIQTDTGVSAVLTSAPQELTEVGVSENPALASISDQQNNEIPQLLVPASNNAPEISVSENPTPTPAPEKPAKLQKPRKVKTPPASKVEPESGERVDDEHSSKKTKLSSARDVQQDEKLPGIPLPILLDPIKRVEIVFELFVDKERKSIGLAHQSYEQKDGYYVVNFQKENSADATADAPSSGDINQMTVSGSISRRVLTPIAYQMVGSIPEFLKIKEKNTDKTMALPGAARSGRVPDGSIDPQSMLFQFTQVPPSISGGPIWIHGGVAFGYYSYRMVGVESLNIASLGVVRAIGLIYSKKESSETIELWLVPAMQYLPVKVRYVDAQGGVFEQMAVSLRYE